jgi:uncharacterized protein (TIGR02421 family)
LPTAGPAERLRALGERLLTAQRGLRVLEALRWDGRVERAFLARGARGLPAVAAEDYRPLPFDVGQKEAELAGLEADIRRSLGEADGPGRLLARRCREARGVVRLLAARGTAEFARRSRELYGTTLGGGDLTAELEGVMGEWVSPGGVFAELGGTVRARLSAAQTAAALAERLSVYFRGEPAVGVCLEDDLLADATADGPSLKLRRAANFHPRDIRLLEVHEGWVHLGTTLNARRQTACAFLARGTPSATRTQEGLAVLMEFLAGVAHPARVRRLLLRTRAVALAERGADFRDVYRLFRESGAPPRESFHHAARVFRGGVPAGGPCTKDLCYGLGLLEVWRGVRAALAAGRSAELPLLFCGKTVFDELPALAELREAGLLRPPAFLPPPFNDPRRLARQVEGLALVRGGFRPGRPAIS